MEMENSLKQLDEYLEKIGRTRWMSEDHDDVKGVEKQPENIEEEEDLIQKSSESHFIVQKSSEENEETSSFVINDEKSRTFTRDSLPNKHNSINTESCNSNGMLDSHLVQSDIDMPFEKEIEEMSDSNFIENVKTESLHFVESEDAANELAEIGLSEESLQEFALSGASSDLTEKTYSENEVSTVEVHPVSLKKSTRPYEKSESFATKQPPGQVTTLLDLSSIGELKRLWVKSDKQVKKVSAKPSTKQVDRKCIVSMTTKNTRTLKRTESPSTVEINVKETVKVRSKPAEKDLSNEVNEKTNIELDKNDSAKNQSTNPCTIPCSVKLMRVEKLKYFENLKVDLSIAKRSTIIKLEDSGQLTVPAKSNRKGLNKNAEQVKKNVQSSIAKMVKKVGSTSKGKKLNQKAKGKNQKKTVHEVLPLTAQKSKSAVKKSVMSADSNSDEILIDTEKAGVRQQVSEESTTTYAELEDIEEPYDMKEEKNKNSDDDDDYFPSDDEKDDDYNPKKKSKRTKTKRTSSTNQAKDIVVKTKIEYPDVEVKATSKKVKGTRIGRPPVLGHFECKYCDFTANEKNLIDKHHFKTHRMVLECKPCKKRFRTVNGILEHNAYKHDGGKPFKCDYEGCLYASKNPLDLERHKAKHDPEMKHVCDICGWRTRWRRNMRHHHTLKHCDERNYKCTICEFAAKRPYDLKEHMYRHTDDKPIQCMTCGFRVKTNFELRSHMLVHSDVRPFKCTFPGCTSSTKTKSDLTKHMRVHQTERPFKCHVCSKGYKDQNSLNKHLTGIHVAERKFKCDICGKSFKNRYALKKHVYLHSGYRPYECSICHWKFTTRNNMEKHMVTHDTNLRPFLCPLCPYAAKEPDHLFAHIGSYHGDKYAYFCELCKKPFKRYMQLKLHYERMHTKKEVESLKKLPTVDLALLKMEMKLELEEEEAKRKRRRNSRSKSKTLSDADIKEEHVDEDFGDTVKDSEEEDFDDVRLNEDTGEIEVVKRKKPNNKHSCKVSDDDDAGINVKRNSDEEKPDNVDNELEKFDQSETNGNKNEISNVRAEENSEVNQFAESQEGEENVMMVDINNVDNDLRQGNDEDDKHEDKKKETIYIAKNDLSTVALYDTFRLPLATRGFKFNYDKTGKKPAKAWFMDTSLMDRQTAERHKKHGRRLGLLPPIPRGHPPKGYKRLKRFVDKRKKQLAENIKKAKFVKDLGLVSKRNVARSKRFKGKYTEFETVEGEMLSVAQVQERLPKFQNLEAEDVTKHTQNKTSLSKTKNMRSKPCNSRNQNKSGKTKGNSEIKPGIKTKSKKKTASKTTKYKTPKLLLSTEKKKQATKFAKGNIRKPTFLGGKNEETSVTGTTERNSFEALESILTELNHSDSGVAESESVLNGEPVVQKKIKKKSDLKTKSETVQKSKLKCPKKSKEKDQTKPKYNKKYVPVKQPMKRKNKSGENESKKLKLAEVEDPSEILMDKPGTMLPNKKQKCTRTKQLKVKIGKDFGKSVTKENHVQEGQDIVYPANVHVPVQNTQLVMVYPMGILQTAGVSESSDIGDQSGVLLAMNGNYSAVTESAVHTERVEFRRDLNDVVTDSFDERPDSENGIKENSDKEIMQQEYAEAVVVKQEPDLTFYTSFAQDASAV